MRIDHVGYAHLFNLGNYENERIEAEAFVTADDEPADVLAQLKDWVLTQGNAKRREREAAEARHHEWLSADRELQTINGQIAAAKVRWEGIAAFFERAGLELPQRWAEDDIPF